MRFRIAKEFLQIIFLRMHVQSRNRPEHPYVEILSDRVDLAVQQRRPRMQENHRALHGQFQD